MLRTNTATSIWKEDLSDNIRTAQINIIVVAANATLTLLLKLEFKVVCLCANLKSSQKRYRIEQTNSVSSEFKDLFLV